MSVKITFVCEKCFAENLKPLVSTDISVEGNGRDGYIAVEIDLSCDYCGDFKVVKIPYV